MTPQREKALALASLITKFEPDPLSIHSAADLIEAAINDAVEERLCELETKLKEFWRRWLDREGVAS